VNLTREVAFSGVGTTEFAKTITDRTGYGLIVEAAMKAIADAGLKKEEIDGLICMEGAATADQNPRVHIAIKERLGLFHLPLCVSLPVGGGTCGASVVMARWAIATGRCKNVLIVAGSARGGAGERSAVGNAQTDAVAAFQGHSPTYEQPYGPLVITYYALIAQRHMYEYGTTSEQLAEIAVACRRHATLNPEAVMGKMGPITVEDVVSSRMITSPLHLLDCCVWTDGAVGLVMTSTERAKDAPKPPVHVLGLGHCSTSYYTGDLARPRPRIGLSLTSTPGKIAGADAFAEAGVSHDEIDFVELYDNFTISALVQFEDLGFCKKGEGGPFVQGGRIQLGGDLPLNLHGGHLSCTFVPWGYVHWVEAVRQLRGEGADRQVPDAAIGLVSTWASTVATYGGVGILARD
jgi:acetyl-CoA acetyltransferase